MIPIKIIKELLINCKGDKTEIHNILNKNEIVVLLKSEAQQVNNYHKDSLPEDGKSRLEVANIKIAEDTLSNNLFKILKTK